MISILLAAYKSDELLRKVFIPSLQNCCVDCEVICYDNGGNNLEKNGLDKEFSFCSKAKSEISWVPIGEGKNVGLNVALNECAKVAKGEYYYLPHTDLYLLPGWDINLIMAARNLCPVTYLFCSRSIEPGFSHIKSQIIENYGNEVSNFQEEKLLENYVRHWSGDIVVNARMPFFMHKFLWTKMNGVDPNYFSYCTDDDLIQTAYDKGVRKFWMVYNSLAYHLQGKSNAQQNVDRDSQKPYEYFVQKWKDKYPDIHHPGQYHPKLIPFESKIK